jgi:predicted metallo-beta-lactamase superfamily hydrolase
MYIMARRKLEEEHIRNLNRGSGGSSYSVILPAHIVRELGWKAKQKLEVRKYGDGILITYREE